MRDAVSLCGQELRSGQGLRICRPACHTSQRILSEKAESISKACYFNYLSHNIIAGRDDNVGMLCAGRAGGVEEDLMERRQGPTPALRLCVEVGDQHGIWR